VKGVVIGTQEERGTMKSKWR